MVMEINGNLITLAKEGVFDVIGHGCNCFCTMKRGIAPQMANEFRCDKYPLEYPDFKGDINKLGQIDFDHVEIQLENRDQICKEIQVVNMYTQYHWNDPDPLSGVPLNYDALYLCLLKMNHLFKANHIGLPKIGCGLAGGDWERVKKIIKNTLNACDVTIVNYEQER